MDAFPQQAPGAAGQNQFPPGEGPKRPHLYIGGLSPRVTEYMLQEIFAVAGPVAGVKIIQDRTAQHGGANYGFVEYQDMRSAETALQTLNGRKIFDMEVKCNWAYQNQVQKGEDLSNHCHVFVGDLSPEVNDDVLKKAFSAFGTLTDARCMWDMNTGKSRGYGFLAFKERADAEQAISSMNGEWLGARPIRVNWANQKNGGEGGPGGPSTLGGHQGGGGNFGANSFGAPASYEQVVNQTPAFNSTIYVGNLVPFASQSDLIPLFQRFGYIVEIRMQADRGFAFVKLDTHENAANAIIHLQGNLVHGRPLKCSWGKDRDGPANQQTPAPISAAPHYMAYQQPHYAQQSPYAHQHQPQQQPQDAAAAAAAMEAWQRQYGAQYAAYMQQQAALQQQYQQGASRPQ